MWLYDVTCSPPEVQTHQFPLLNKNVDGCAQPAVCRFTENSVNSEILSPNVLVAVHVQFATVPHSSQTYRSVQHGLAGRSRPQHEHDDEVSCSDTGSTVIPSTLGFVFEEVGEAVERPRVPTAIPDRTPVL